MQPIGKVDFSSIITELGFIIRKINKLIIPFLFFYLSAFLLKYIIYRLMGYSSLAGSSLVCKSYNPYYVLNQRHNSDERWRAFGYYGAKINFTDWLHLSAKYAFDYYRRCV